MPYIYPGQVYQTSVHYYIDSEYFRRAAFRCQCMEMESVSGVKVVQEKQEKSKHNMGNIAKFSISVETISTNEEK